MFSEQPLYNKKSQKPEEPGPRLKVLGPAHTLLEEQCTRCLTSPDSSFLLHRVKGLY